MRPGHDVGRPVFRGEIVERPHGADLQLHTLDADRVDAVVPVQRLGRFAGQDLDAGATADSVVDAVRQQDFVDDAERKRFTDQVGRCPGTGQDLAQPERLVAFEIRIVFVPVLVEMRPQLRGDPVGQRFTGAVLDDGGSGITQRRGNDTNFIVTGEARNASRFTVGRIDQHAQTHRQAFTAGQRKLSPVVGLNRVGAPFADLGKDVQAGTQYRVRRSIFARYRTTVDHDNPVVTEVDLERRAKTLAYQSPIKYPDQVVHPVDHSYSP